VAARDGADGVDELLGLGVLEEEPARAGLEPGEDVVVAVEGREDDDLRQVRLDDAPGGLDAVEHRHLHVHEHDVGAQLGGAPHGLGTVGGLADHLEVVLHREDEGEPGADELLVVDEQDGRHGVSSGSGMRTRTR